MKREIETLYNRVAYLRQKPRGDQFGYDGREIQAILWAIDRVRERDQLRAQLATAVEALEAVMTAAPGDYMPMVAECLAAIRGRE